MSPEEQAQALSRWLSEPAGTDPPGELDPDVVESVYALRPDIAPAPRVSADDILASLTAGPLVDPATVAAPEESEGQGGEVVAFPSPERVEAAPTAEPRRNWWRAMNQWGGISAVVATAATLAVIALPVLQMSNEEAGPTPATAVEEAAVPAVADAPAVASQKAAEVPQERVSAAQEVAAASGKADQGARVQTRDAEIADLENNVDAVADLGDEVSDGFLDMAGGMGAVAEVDEDTDIIPEAQAPAQPPQMIQQETYAGEPYSNTGNTANTGFELDNLDDLPEAEEEQIAKSISRGASKKQRNRQDKDAAADDVVDLTKLRAQADPGLIGTGWRNHVDGGTLAGVDAAIASAEFEARAGKYKLAGDLLAEFITAPASMGQAQAIAAADYYLRDGRDEQIQAAIAAVRRGLTLSQDNTAARAKLEVIHGDALKRFGEYVAAEAAYRRAAQINAAR